MDIHFILNIVYLCIKYSSRMSLKKFKLPGFAFLVVPFYQRVTLVSHIFFQKPFDNIQQAI